MKRLILAIAVLGALALPAAAAATPYHPTGEFAPFGDCPLSRPTLNACIYSETTGGYFTMGQKNVPIKNTVILQGGQEFVEGESLFFGAEDGNTLSKTPQPVPGGLLGIQAPWWWPSLLRELFNETINNGFTGVTATVELAAPATSIKLDPIKIITQQGTALSLPVKIKLDNPFLGSNCYVGSNSNPIVIDFTTGTTSPPPPNQPITGSPGQLESRESGLLVESGGRLVNNSFAAPGAHGCGGIFSLLVDPFVNSIVGLPSPAGTNAAVLEGKLQAAPAEGVRASE